MAPDANPGIAWGADEIWVLFYAERNQQQEAEGLPRMSS